MGVQSKDSQVPHGPCDMIFLLFSTIGKQIVNIYCFSAIEIQPRCKKTKDKQENKKTNNKKLAENHLKWLDFNFTG